MLFEITTTTTRKPIVMKRILAILPLLSLIVISCNREPFAEATVDLNPSYVGEDVRFTSYSTNTDYVEWDMDDGIMYTTSVVDHYFIDPGFYDVSLRAFGTKGGVSTAVIPMEVIGAELTVVVRLWTEVVGQGYLLPDASVRLYPTLTDWENETNMVAEAFSDSYGECTFTNLSYQRYYIDVWEANHDNYTLAAEDVSFIETDMLEGAYYWTFEALVDYYAKKSTTGTERPLKALKAATAGEKRTATDLVTKVKRERK
jgi:PKD repeat protein